MQKKVIHIPRMALRRDFIIKKLFHNCTLKRSFTFLTKSEDRGTKTASHLSFASLQKIRNIKEVDQRRHRLLKLQDCFRSLKNNYQTSEEVRKPYFFPPSSLMILNEKHIQAVPPLIRVTEMRNQERSCLYKDRKPYKYKKAIQPSKLRLKELFVNRSLDQICRSNGTHEVCRRQSKQRQSALKPFVKRVNRSDKKTSRGKAATPLQFYLRFIRRRAINLSSTLIEPLQKNLIMYKIPNFRLKSITGRHRSQSSWDDTFWGSLRNFDYYKLSSHIYPASSVAATGAIVDNKEGNIVFEDNMVPLINIETGGATSTSAYTMYSSRNSELSAVLPQSSKLLTESIVSEKNTDASKDLNKPMINLKEVPEAEEKACCDRESLSVSHLPIKWIYNPNGSEKNNMSTANDAFHFESLAAADGSKILGTDVQHVSELQADSPNLAEDANPTIKKDSSSPNEADHIRKFTNLLSIPAFTQWYGESHGTVFLSNQKGDHTPLWHSERFEIDGSSDSVSVENKENVANSQRIPCINEGSDDVTTFVSEIGDLNRLAQHSAENRTDASESQNLLNNHCSQQIVTDMGVVKSGLDNKFLPPLLISNERSTAQIMKNFPGIQDVAIHKPRVSAPMNGDGIPLVSDACKGALINSKAQELEAENSVGSDTASFAQERNGIQSSSRDIHNDDFTQKNVTVANTEVDGIIPFYDLLYGSNDCWKQVIAGTQHDSLNDNNAVKSNASKSNSNTDKFNHEEERLAEAGSLSDTFVLRESEDTLRSISDSQLSPVTQSVAAASNVHPMPSEQPAVKVFDDTANTSLVDNFNVSSVNPSKAIAAKNDDGLLGVPPAQEECTQAFGKSSTLNFAQNSIAFMDPVKRHYQEYFTGIYEDQAAGTNSERIASQEAQRYGMNSANFCCNKSKEAVGDFEYLLDDARYSRLNLTNSAPDALESNERNLNLHSASFFEALTIEKLGDKRFGDPTEILKRLTENEAQLTELMRNSVASSERIKRLRAERLCWQVACALLPGVAFACGLFYFDIGDSLGFWVE